MKARRLAVLAACLLSSGFARAAEPARRPLPDYDGRGGKPTTLSRKALWVPRVLLSPAYFVSEFLIRRPLGATITAAEKAHVPRALYDFFAFGPDHKAGILPITLIDFGVEPSIGFYAFWDDAGFIGHQLRLHGSTWGANWLSLTATERFRFSERFLLALTTTATRRPDYAFCGIGPDSREASLMRYAADTVESRVQSSLSFAGSSLLETSVGYRGAAFGHSNYDDTNRGTAAYEPSVDEALRGREPPGFVSGFRAPFARTRLALDTRGRSPSESGARIELSGEQGVDLKNEPSSGWLRYGGTVGGFWDLLDSGRVLSLSISALLADPLGERPVPFSQLVTLGGLNLMPGFRSGRLHGRSAAVATLRYSWPIWVWLDGSLQVATGNVFGAQFDGFRTGRSRLSTALGIESRGSRDSVFQALVGFGSETFESGGKIDALRIVLGVRNGF